MKSKNSLRIKLLSYWLGMFLLGLALGAILAYYYSYPEVPEKIKFLEPLIP